VSEPEAIEYSRATIVRFNDWLALLDGEPVGVESCSLNPGMEEDTAAFAFACVLPEARGQGVGTVIYRQVSAHARELGKSDLMGAGERVARESRDHQARARRRLTANRTFGTGERKGGSDAL
jgi:GNAT superfamily N-acetyltransferase